MSGVLDAILPSSAVNPPVDRQAGWRWGMALAEPGATRERVGCLTPATALGTACVERFEPARLRFSVRA